MSGAWVTNQSYGNRNIRMQGGVVKYDSLESFMAITSNDYCDCISGELIIPMARNNVNSSFGNKLFYGQFISVLLFVVCGGAAQYLLAFFGFFIYILLIG